VAFAPDGTRLATVGRDSYTKIWEFPSLRLVASLEDHTTEVNTVAYSPDGKLIVTGGDDGKLIVRNADDYRILFSLPHPHAAEGDFVSAILFSPDGARLYSACGGYLHAWQPTTGEHLLSVRAHAQTIKSMSLSPDGSKILTVRGDAKVWTTDWFEQVAELPPAADGYYTTGCYVGGGEQLAMGESRGSISIRNSLDFERTVRLGTSQQLDVLRICTSPDGQYLVAGAAGRTVDVFAIETWEEVAHLDHHADRVWDVLFTPDGSRIVSCGADGDVVIWKLPPGGEWRHASGRLTLDDGGLRIETSAYSPDGRWLACGMEARRITLFDRLDGSIAHLALDDLQGATVVGLKFTRDGRRLISGHANAQVLVWDVASRRRLSNIELPGQLYAMAVSPREDRLAAAVTDEAQGDHVVLLEWPGGRQLQSFPLVDQLTAICFTPDGEELLIAEPGRLTSRNVRSFATRLAFGKSGETFSDIDFLPDGRRMIVAEWRQGAAIRDLETGAVLTRLSGHPGVVAAVAAHPNGRNVVTQCDRDVMQIWDLDTERALLNFDDIRAPLRGGLRFDPRGRELALYQHRPGYELSIWDGRPSAADFGTRSVSASAGPR
jgi:WD40 repeat protein